MRYKSRLLVSLIAVSLALAGCGGGGGQRSPSGNTSGGALDRSAELRLATNAFGTSFDPHLSRNFATDVPWDFPIYDRLLSFADNKLEPMLAESWELADDRRTLTMKLRSGVTFHDGTPFDAEAVAANITRGKELDGSTVARVFALIDSVQTPDAGTVVFNLNGDGSLLPYSLADIPGAMISPAAFDGNVAQQPVGAGPYKLVSSTSDSATYERFDGYWAPDRAKVAKITYRSIPDDNARFNALRTGQLDVMQLPATIFQQAQELETRGQAKIERALGSAVIGILLNTKHPQLSDERVRRALNLAVNREAINDGLMEGECVPALQPFTAASVGNDPALDSQIRYDQAEARRLLAEAGVTNLVLRTNVVGVSPYTEIAQAVQAQLAEVGITLELTNVPGGEARAEWRKGGWDAFSALITAGVDPALTLSTSYLATDAVGGPASPELTALVDESAQFAIGSPERASAMQKISGHLTGSPTHIMVCAPQFGWLTGTNVQVEPGAFYSYSYIFDPTRLGITS
ncbi:ABC transporter substrate-binding protein [Polymorphospora lycopeni]|uniref:ABC transporter substrate-binding protein n=1 Tax=Polymorphospora lycopeni TaxID=3140240 RepID=A0ABV5CMP2_9ACTN